MTTRTIDTNVLVRLLARDDSEQWKRAADLAMRFQLVVLPTVMLETEWVLRSQFRFDRQRIAELFRMLASSEAFVLIERERVTRALDGFEKGMDFADALHVFGMSEGETFVTFDRDLVRLAKRHIDTASVELAY